MSATQITPQDAFTLLRNQKSAILVDVRTQEEFNLVGVVDAQSFENRMLLLPLFNLPDMHLNPEFSLQLSQKATLDQELLFICRSGYRSNQACEFANSLGFKKCYNIINGFEGDLDINQHRSSLNGWKVSQLPWRQQ